MKKDSVSVFWFRRDLRLKDNAALYYALKHNENVLPIFIFDSNILNNLDDKTDKRVEFIVKAVEELSEELIKLSSCLHTFFDTPVNVFKHLTNEYSINTVYTNHDYELYALQRDELIEKFLQTNNIAFKTYKDQVIFEKDEVVKDDGKPYTVFTPYSKKWLLKLNDFYASSYPSEKYFNNFYKCQPAQTLAVENLGFGSSNTIFPKKSLNVELVKKYSEQRDFPAINGTSKLGIHLRFGTISIRKLLQYSLPLNNTFVNELIWRDFYFSILFHFKHINNGLAFRQEYDAIQWLNNEQDFEHWCNGNTGYPIVDAGMRELNATGYMHNRVRMIVASFLTKHLLIDWRWGEAYFAQKLLDYDFAANNGGWQWAAGCGCDAAPYFRIFNPTLQAQKFDKNGVYVKKWIPEINTTNYCTPIIEHSAARKRCLEVYSQALKK